MEYNKDPLLDERLYLKGKDNQDIIKEIMELKEIRKEMIQKNTEYYANAIAEYHKYIKFISSFIKDLKTDDNAIVISILLRELMFKGYFSDKNRLNTTGFATFYEIAGYEGMDIIAGNGHCRHFSGFYNDIFKEMNIPSHLIPCYLSKYSECTINEAFLAPANHVMNSVNYNGVEYAYDHYTDLVLEYINPFLMQEITDLEGYLPDEDIMKAFYKPSIEIILYEATAVDDIIKRIHFLKENCQKEHIDYYDCIEFGIIVRDLLTYMPKTFEEFKKESRPYTKKISDEMKKVHPNINLDKSFPVNNKTLVLKK